MISKWQWAAIGFLVAMLIAFAIYTSPNSFAYLALAGKCNTTPMPAACTPRRSGGLVRTTGW